MSEIEVRLLEIFRHILKNDKLVLHSNSSSKDVKGWDSLAQVELIAEMEQVFQVEFTLRDIINMTSFGSIIKLISEKKSNGSVQ